MRLCFGDIIGQSCAGDLCMKMLLLILAGLLGTSLAEARPHAMRMVATAFSKPGITAEGTSAHIGVAAADPALLPLGSRIFVRGAGPYSGYYVVRDTGDKIQGRKIDLFIPSAAAARRFGKRIVSVRVLRPRVHAKGVA
jgi:3D (Asp-Asp-Asp) domain-containing protein